MARWNIIADDLTGACDTGAVFAQAGLPTRVLLEPSALGGATGKLPAASNPEDAGGVFCVTTESRHLAAAEATAVIRRVVDKIAVGPGSQVYKKIDSTLRGQPGAELAALMEHLGLARALVAPAFPGQGRMVRGGRLWVNGLRLEDTVFAREVASGELAVLFAGLPVHMLELEEVRRGSDWLSGRIGAGGVWLADAETEEDLRTLAAAARRSEIRLLCGSAGLARAVVAENVVGNDRPVVGPEPARLRASQVLVVAGSRHPATLKQVEAAEQTGLSVHRPDWDDLRVAERAEACVDSLTRVLMEGHSLVLSAEGLLPMPGSEAQVAEGLAGLACAALLQAGFAGGLVLTGGDTAMAVCRALGCRAIELRGEIQPGLGWGYLADGMMPGLPVATKAGGFGGEDALVEAMEFLGRLS